MASPGYDVLLFDLDGTLTDPFEGITKCIVHALERLERVSPTQNDLRWCIGPSLYESFAQLLKTDDPELVHRAVAHYRERFGVHGMYENTLFDSVADIVAGLARTEPLFVATSKPWFFAEKIVSHFGLQGHFKKVYGSELSGERVNKADLLSHLLKSEAIDPSRALMIGDREHDILGAKANGIRSAGVLWGYGSREELEAAGADYIFETPVDIERVVKGI